MVGTITRHEIPRSAEEVDYDRLVWDPDYREAVRHLIEEPADDQEGPERAPQPDNERSGSRF